MMPKAAKTLTANLQLTSDAQRIDLAALTMVINSLFNLDGPKRGSNRAMSEHL